MAESERVTSISKSKSLQELAEFWDTHDLTDFEDQIHEVHFDVDIRSHKHYVAIDPDLMAKVRQVAHARGLRSESLVNLWLQQQLQEAEPQAA